AARRRPAVPQRPAVNPLRPGRPRTLIQRVEPRIQSMPVSERPVASPLAQGAQGVQNAAMPEAAGEPAHETALPAPAAPAGGGSPAPHLPTAPTAPTTPISSAPSAPGAVYRPAPTSAQPARPAAPISTYTRPAQGAPAPSRPQPGSAAAAASAASEARRRAEARERENAKKAKQGKRAPARPTIDEELTTFKGSVSDLDAAEDDLAAGTNSRRGRRAQRKEDEKGTSEDGGKLLTFKKAPGGAVMISEGMTVRDFSDKLGIKSRDLIKMLFDRGVMATLNYVLPAETAEELARQLGVETMVVSFEEEQQLKEEQLAPAGIETAVKKVARGPVVTIMGHVDHGKTSLLDAIRSSKVTESEHGGITQHIGAYQVEVNGKQIVFVDTPGHEAFTMMRARGAKVTDIVVLVVAADDGVMPQTVEAIDHARAARVPIVVAINKIDKANANLDRVKKELSDRGLVPEDWGGDTVMVPISALKKQGIPELMEMILLNADILDLKANPEINAQGVVLEARKEVGRGIIATVLVQNGTLKIGDVFVSGAISGRVRSMTDDLGRRVKEAGPATPVEVTGFNDVPEAGDPIQVVADEAQARGIAEFRGEQQRRRDLSPTQGRMSLEQLFTRIQEGEVKELPVVLKADVQGSVEVLREALGKIASDKVKVNVIHSGVGAISTNDVLLASASKAIIVGFTVRPERAAVDLAEKEEVDIRLHTVIYELIDELKKAMTGLLDPTYREVAAGRAEVRDTFKVPKVGTIAGCHVIEGVIPRSAAVRLLRDNRVIYEGKIASLRRFKDDASEVRAGFDCGIGLERFQDVKPGDVIEAYVREEVAPVL
ncbi:MAG TPA: translation initiation factor IF-2, partial [Thermoanaerobaculia bacterium]